MRYLVCKKCCTVYNADFINPRYPDVCPKADCNYKLAELDEEMIIPITKLWSKGYATKYSCSGHIFDDPMAGGYIMFGEYNMPNSCPDGWYVDDDCIRYDFPKINGKHTRRDIIKEKIDNLNKWAANLEFCAEAKENEDET